MPNFYNIAEIRFQNITANDSVISSKLTAIIEGRWELMFLSRSEEANIGDDDVPGLFITRHQFDKE